MKATFRQPALGAEDGLRAYYFEAGSTYELGPVLSKAFLGAGIAESAEPDAIAVEPRRSTTQDELRLGRWLMDAQKNAEQARSC